MTDPYRKDGDERAQSPEDYTPSPSGVGDTGTDHDHNFDQNPETRVDGVVEDVDTELSTNDSRTVHDDLDDDSDDDGYRYTEKDTVRNKNNRRLLAFFIAIAVVAVISVVLILRSLWSSVGDDDEYYQVIESPDESTSTAPAQPGYGQDRDNITGETDDQDAVDDRGDGTSEDTAPESDVDEAESFLFGDNGAGTQIYDSTGSSPIGGGASPTSDDQLRQNVYNTIQEMYDVLGSVPNPESSEFANAANSYLYADQRAAYTLFVGQHAGWTIDYDRTEVFDPTTEGNEPRVSVTWVTEDGQTAYIIEGYYDTFINAIKPNYTGTTEVGQKSLYDVQ